MVNTSKSATVVVADTLRTVGENYAAAMAAVAAFEERYLQARAARRRRFTANPLLRYARSLAPPVS